MIFIKDTHHNFSESELDASLILLDDFVAAEEPERENGKTNQLPENEEHTRGRV